MVRREMAAAEEKGLNWRSIIDSYRPINQKIWQTLPNKEKRRFLRHLRPYWDLHRHRIAATVADQIEQEVESGRIQVHAGRLTRYYEFVGGVCAAFRERYRGDTLKLQVDRVINCTGPDSDFSKIECPLIASLFRTKLARPDELSLGLDVSETGELIDAEGNSSKFLYALGPLRKGNLWESIAVPELREQTAAIANLLIASMASDVEESAEVVCH